jgi:hypothetical protein
VTPSSQLGAAHCVALQTLLSQSLPSAQWPPEGQGEHDAPPQSTSVSAPFSWPSVQLGAAHCPAVHMSL